MATVTLLGGHLVAAQEAPPTEPVSVQPTPPSTTVADESLTDPLWTEDHPDSVELPARSRAQAAVAAAPVIYPLRRFPVQGPCNFIDSYGAPRGTGRWHQGVDIIAKQGQELYATFDGVITYRYDDRPGSRAGNGLRLTKAGSKDYVFYAHLKAFAPGIRPGAKVKAGRLLGWVGKTGNAGIPHLHFEIHPGGGNPINPTPSVRRINGCKRATPPVSSTKPTTTTKPVTTTKPGSTTTTDAWWSTEPGVSTTTTKPRSTTTTTKPKPTTTTTKPRSTSTTKPAPTTTKPKPTTTTKASAAAPGGRLVITTGTRLVDTRVSGGRVPGGTARQYRIAGVGGIPAGAAAVVLNIFVSSPAGNGVVSVYPCGAAGGGATTTVSFTSGKFSSNTVYVGLRKGNVCVRPSVAADIVIDTVAYSGGKATPMGVTNISPVRVADTREKAAPMKAGEVRRFKVTGLRGVPASNALSLAITAVNANSSGTVAVWACDRDRPEVSTFVAIAGQATTGNTISRVSANGTVCVSTSKAMDLLIDVHAAWALGSARPLRPIAPIRVINTKVSAGSAVSAKVAGRNGVPANAKSVAVTLTINGAATTGTATVWACGTTKPSTRVLTVGAGGRASGSTLIGIGAGGKVCANSTTGGRLTLDITGFAG